MRGDGLRRSGNPFPSPEDPRRPQTPSRLPACPHPQGKCSGNSAPHLRRSPAALPGLFPPPLHSRQLPPISSFHTARTHFGDSLEPLRGRASVLVSPFPPPHLRARARARARARTREATPVRPDHRDARTSARPRAVPEVPAGGGGAGGARGAAGSASAAAAERGRICGALEHLRCGPAPLARGPAPAQVSGPAPAQVSGSASASVPSCPSGGPGCRSPPTVGSIYGRWRRRPGGVCGSAAALEPPTRNP